MKRGMTLIPRLFSHWWKTLERQHWLLDRYFSRLDRPFGRLDRHFGRLDRQFGRLDQLFSSVFERQAFKSFPNSFYLDNDEYSLSIIKTDNRFQVILDVKQFKPEEVNVKVVDNFIVVECKHEKAGLISRHFIGKYLVDQYDSEKAISTLSSNGILTIIVPLRPDVAKSKREKTIKVEQTGKVMEDDESQKIKQNQ